jgi:hypothetical protein
MAVLGAKRAKLHTIKSSGSQICKLFETVFCFVWLKYQLNICKFVFLSFHALLDNYCIFCQKMADFGAKTTKLGLQKQL